MENQTAPTIHALLEVITLNAKLGRSEVSGEIKALAEKALTKTLQDVIDQDTEKFLEGLKESIVKEIIK